MSTNQDQQPGLVGSHASYVSGAAQEKIGDALEYAGQTDSAKSWQSSGQQVQSDARDAMKAAGEQRDSQASGKGYVEEMAGKAVGCEGMEVEGRETKTAE